jgi:translin
MDNLEGIIDKIEKQINDKDQAREKALRFSRTIIITCRKGIQKIHQKQYTEADKMIKKASASLAELYDSTKDFPDLYNAGFVENASQEFVEAHCLYNILQGKDLPDPDSIQTTYTSYLTGLCDVVGELRRKALDTVLEGQHKEAVAYLNIMEEIYDAVLRFDYPSSLVPIKRKQDIARSLIEKTRGELAVASCEQRIEYRTDEFRGLLDKINKEPKKKKKKQVKKDLDLDRVL